MIVVLYGLIKLRTSFGMYKPSTQTHNHSNIATCCAGKLGEAGDEETQIFSLNEIGGSSKRHLATTPKSKCYYLYLSTLIARKYECRCKYLWKCYEYYKYYTSIIRYYRILYGIVRYFRILSVFYQYYSTIKYYRILLVL